MKISVETVLLQLVRGGAEGVRLDDVRAGTYVFLMNLAHQIRVAQVQFVVAVIDVHAFRVEHGTHSAVDDEDAISGEKFLKWLHWCWQRKSPAPNNAGLQIHLKFSGLYQAARAV